MEQSKMFKEFIEILSVATNVEELKKMYRKLAIKYHPDHSKDDGSSFIALQEAFEMLHDKLKSGDKDAWKHKESASDFMDIINEIIRYNVDVEIIGSWIYVKGTETKAIKDTVLKPLKFWWSRKHLAWIYSGQQGKTRRRATKKNPRDIYNVEVVRTQKALAYNN